MLTKIRENITGWVAYVIVGFLAIPFALWGIQSYFTSSSSVIADVGGSEINLNQFDNMVIERKRILESSEKYDTSELDIARQALSSLVSNKLVDNAVEEYSYQASNSQIVQSLLSVTEFQDETTGQFDEEKYRAYLKSIQASQNNYEATIRNRIRRQQFARQAMVSEFILPNEQKDYDQLVNEVRDVDYLVIDTQHYLKSEKVTDEEVRQEYDANQSEYMTVPKVRLRYAEIKLSNLSDGIVSSDINEEDIKQYYEDNQDQFVEIEARQVNHILFNSQMHSSEEIAERIKEAKHLIAEGVDFAQIVERYSDDFLTAENGGELPALNEFDIADDNVRDTIFSMAEGDISEPTSSQFGIQIFQLVKITPEVQQTLSESREIIREAINNENALNQYETIVNDLTEISETAQKEIFNEFNAYGVASTLTEMTEITSDASILRYPQVRRTLYNEMIRNNAPNSGPIEIIEGAHTIFFAVDGFEQRKQLSFKEVKKDIRSQMLLVKGFKSSEEQTNEWVKQLQKDELSFNELSKNKWINKEQLGYVKRFDFQGDPKESLVNNAFSVDYMKGKEGYGLTNIENNIVLFRVTDSKYQKGDDEVLLSFARRESQAIIESVEKKFNVQIYQENIPQFKEQNQ